MRRNIKLLLALILVSVGLQAFNQSTNQITSIDRVKFRLSAWRPKPYNSVFIEILKTDSLIKANVYLHRKNRSKPNSSYTVSSEQFAELIKTLRTVTSADTVEGFDGETWVIEFGNKDSTVTHHIWMPRQETNKRKLENFITAGKMIWRLGRLKEDKL